MAACAAVLPSHDVMTTRDIEYDLLASRYADDSDEEAPTAAAAAPSTGAATAAVAAPGNDPTAALHDEDEEDEDWGDEEDYSEDDDDDGELAAVLDWADWREAQANRGNAPGGGVFHGAAHRPNAAGAAPAKTGAEG